jgi:hypothetical protein
MEDEKMEEKHLCSDCQNDFPTCEAKEIVWGIDKHPDATGADADMVLECDSFVALERV